MPSYVSLLIAPALVLVPFLVSRCRTGRTNARRRRWTTAAAVLCLTIAATIAPAIWPSPLMAEQSMAEPAAKQAEGSAREEVAEKPAAQAEPETEKSEAGPESRSDADRPESERGPAEPKTAPAKPEAGKPQEPQIESRFLRGLFNLILLAILVTAVFAPFLAARRLARNWKEPLWSWPVGLILLCAAMAFVVFSLRWLLAPLPDGFGKTFERYLLGLTGLLPLWVTIGVVAVPIWLGAYLSRKWRMPDHATRIGVVSFALLAGLAITISGWPPQLGIDLSGGVILVYEVEDQLGTGESEPAAPQGKAKANPQGDGNEEKNDADVARTADVDMDKLIQAIIRRVNPGGVKEVTIRQYGERQVEVIIPQKVDKERGQDEAVARAEVERIKNKISSAGTLEFRILANNRDHVSLIEQAKEIEGRRLETTTGKLLAWWVPVAKGEEESFHYPEIATRKMTRDDYDYTEVLVVKDEYDVTGGYLVRAAPSIDQSGRPNVLFTFNAEGGRLFGALTSDNLPEEGQEFSRKLGIILDGELQSAPAIKTTIFRNGEITGDFTRQEVQDLVDILNAGSLPTALSKDPISEMNIGPTLGRDTVRRGRIAIMVSMGLVLLFMLVYYRFAGMVACLALLMNLVLILAAMISIQAAFTLPGLAGLVLTVGMAVDANVLIFERIREELARQATLRMAIRNGFGRATTTIVDANLTTLITATVLYWIGTDQIKGFAVTLWLGVVMSMFTAIYCSRLVFDVAERRRWISRLKMLRMLGETRIDFLAMRRAALAASVLVIAVGLGAVGYRRAGLLDIDFTGGVSIDVAFRKPAPGAGESEVSVGFVRQTLAGKLLDLAVSDVETFEEETTVHQFRINTSGAAPELSQAELAKSVQEAFPGELADSSVEPDPEGGFLIDVRFTEPHKSSDVKARLENAKLESPKVNSLEPQGGQGSGQDFRISTSGLPQIAVVKAVLQEAFGDILAHYSMKATLLDEPQASETASSRERQTAQPAETDEPDVGAHSRGNLPPSSLLASADASAVLLAQAESTSQDAASADGKAEEASAKSPPGGRSADAPPDEASSAPGPDEPPAQPANEAKLPPAEKRAPSAGKSAPEPAGKPVPAAKAPAAAETRAELAFDHKVDYLRLDELLKEQIAEAQKEDRLPAGVFAKLFVDRELSRVDDEAILQTWYVRLNVPPDQAQPLLRAIQERIALEPVFPSSNMIGSKVAEGFRVLGIVALLASLVGIVAYIWFRFQRVMFGLAAVVALVHDVLVTLGVIALSAYVAPYLGWLLIGEFKIGLSVLAAFLTIIGYSLNDTIVVFDRIREVRGKAPKLTAEMINNSINQTLSRTLLTSLTTLIVVVVLYVGGGQAIHVFAFSLVIGVVVGTYSSIFVASPVLFWMAQASGADPRRRPRARLS